MRNGDDFFDLKHNFFFPDDSDHLIFSNRSFTYVALGQFEEALVDADAAIKLKPDWPKVSIYYTNCTLFLK